ncbi:DNA-binding winged helix-turn-helix (wHTH) domain-containing protein [Halopseudomonas xinjiangensis]|uniref:DNA-binding winged helix-turn-helix (WHTH) domain-containing protein n=1 Tax=Halopseudomonas xinjiangensis TaxID=487184 RepID=A0A1H1TYV1_9GAMM|nr:winged helix-turn-helix domain-containing protein [Halopseudomonas xinjiangensis]SDS65408.1 DNA-binding winged helix-turn-helix (wHTH) domain-containing protein [Halopseudomonas xinjiangensis]
MYTLSQSYRRTPSRYYFGCAEFCPETLELSVLGETISLERRPLRLLHVLLQHVDRVVSHEELLREAWDGRVTVKNVLPNAMTKLRKALDRDAKLIVTIPGVGYRFNGPVRFDSAEFSTANHAPLAPSGTAAPVGCSALDVLPIRVAGPLVAELAITDRSPAAKLEQAKPVMSDLLQGVNLQKRLEAFHQFAESVARRHSSGLGYNAISRLDLHLYADGRLVLLARRPVDVSPGSVSLHDPYRAPELYRGQVGTERSDIYALGVILYQLCCADIGRPLLGDWRTDVGDQRYQLLIESATYPDPAKRPASVADWLAIPDEDAASGWQRMLGLPIRLSRWSRV